MSVTVSGDASGPVTNSIILTLTGVSGAALGQTYTLTINGNRSSNSLLLRTKNLAGSTIVTTGSPSAFLTTSPSANLLDGGYLVSARYTRVSNGTVINSGTSLLVHVATPNFAMSFTSPASSSWHATLPIAFDISNSETYTSGTLKLIFSNIAGVYNTITLTDMGTSAASFTLNPANILASAQVVAATQPTLPDGVYSVVLSYTTSVDSIVVSQTRAPVVIDTFQPVIASVTNIPSLTTSHTPSYTFITSEAGTITYGGACSSATTTAVQGNNTIVLNSLADGTYSNCTLTVTDTAGNVSATHTIATFTIDTTAPVIVIISPTNAALVSTWAPSVNWGGGSVCAFSYDNSSFTTVNCANSGSDITAPGSSGSTTLYVRADDAAANRGTTSVTFSYLTSLTASGFRVLPTPTPAIPTVSETVDTPADLQLSLVDAEGGPVGGAVVEVNALGSLVSDADGTVILRDIPELFTGQESFVVRIRKDGLSFGLATVDRLEPRTLIADAATASADVTQCVETDLADARRAVSKPLTSLYWHTRSALHRAIPSLRRQSQQARLQALDYRIAQRYFRLHRAQLAIPTRQLSCDAAVACQALDLTGSLRTITQESDRMYREVIGLRSIRIQGGTSSRRRLAITLQRVRSLRQQVRRATASFAPRAERCE